MTSKKQKGKRFTLQDIAKGNPRIDEGVIASHRCLERRLKKLGVEIRPRYGLTPPLGGDRLHLYNEDRLRH